MSDIKKDLSDFESHCLNTDQLQVAELIQNAIKRIAELERENKGLSVALSMPTSVDALTTEAFALEQQAKGLSKYVSDAMDHYWILHLNENISYHNFLIGLNERASKLREQAAKIKEQK